MLALPPYTLPREVKVTMDLRVLLFALAVSVHRHPLRPCARPASGAAETCRV